MNATVSHHMSRSARGREKKQKKQGHILRSTVYFYVGTGTVTSPRATGRPSASRNRQIAPEIEQRTERRP